MFDIDRAAERYYDRLYDRYYADCEDAWDHDDPDWTWVDDYYASSDSEKINAEIADLVRDYIEYGKVWSANLGLFYSATVVLSSFSQNMDPGIVRSAIGILVMAGFVVSIFFARYKSAAFGKSQAFTLLLEIFPFIGNLILGFGSDRYLGNPS